MGHIKDDHLQQLSGHRGNGQPQAISQTITSTAHFKWFSRGRRYHKQSPSLNHCRSAHAAGSHITNGHLHSAVAMAFISAVAISQTITYSGSERAISIAITFHFHAPESSLGDTCTI